MEQSRIGQNMAEWSRTENMKCDRGGWDTAEQAWAGQNRVGQNIT